MGLDQGQRTLLRDAFDRYGNGPVIPEGELLERFDEVMELLGTFLVDAGVGDDGKLNTIGRRIEQLEDFLVKEKIRRMEQEQ